MIRDIIIFVVGLAIGIAAAAGYFYTIHGHDPMQDVPKVREDYEKVVDKGKEAVDRWKTGNPTPTGETSPTPR